MTSDRTQAYGRVVRTLDDIGPTKLHADEQARIREAADTLIFASSITEAPGVVEDIESLAGSLVESGRWSEDRARALVDDVLGCGPLAPVG